MVERRIDRRRFFQPTPKSSFRSPVVQSLWLLGQHPEYYLLLERLCWWTTRFPDIAPCRELTARHRGLSVHITTGVEGAHQQHLDVPRCYHHFSHLDRFIRRQRPLHSLVLRSLLAWITNHYRSQRSDFLLYRCSISIDLFGKKLLRGQSIAEYMQG